jgi:hypothetical protein
MRSSTARALLALILLAVALEAVPTEQQATVLQPLTLTATLYIEPGDALAPHIYDWYFDGVDDYVVIPLTVYGWPDMTVQEWLYPYYPKANSAYSKFSMIGDYWIDRPSIFYATNNRHDYIWLDLAFVTRRPDGTIRSYDFSIYAYRNVWVNVAYRFGLEDRVFAGYVNGARVYTTTVPSTEYTILEWNPDTATRPWMYRRLVLGASVEFLEHMKVMQGSILVYSRALSDMEIARAYNANIVDANGLALFLDATFYNGTHYVDLSGNDNHGVGYGGVSRVLSSRPHLYLVKGLHSDGLVHFRFFPVNTVVDVYDAATNGLVASFTVDGPANPAGMVEDYAVSLGPGSYRLAVYTTVYVQVAQPALPAHKLVVAHFKAEFGPGCRVYIDYTAWPKAEPRTECGLQTDSVFLTGLPAGATVRVWNETVLYEVTASSTGVAILGGLKPGAYEVKVYSETLSIPYDHLLRLDPLTGLRQFFGFWDRLTFNLFTPVFVVGLVLAVYLRTWSAILTALVALVAHIAIAPDNIWIRGLLALALAVAVYIAVWRRTTLI